MSLSEKNVSVLAWYWVDSLPRTEFKHTIDINTVGSKALRTFSKWCLHKALLTTFIKNCPRSLTRYEMLDYNWSVEVFC